MCELGVWLTWWGEGDNIVRLSLDSVSSPKWGLCLGTVIYGPGWDSGVSKGLNWTELNWRGWLVIHSKGLSVIFKVWTQSWDRCSASGSGVGSKLAGLRGLQGIKERDGSRRCVWRICSQAGERERKPNERVNLWRNEVSIHLEEHFRLVFGIQVLRRWLQLRPGDKVAIQDWRDRVV